MKRIKRKAFAYITHNHHLLVFRHPHYPEAGIQVPAGTIEENEHPENTVMREALEETGLTGLIFQCFLGYQERDMSDFDYDEIHQRYFYHLHCDEQPPAIWQHEEKHPSDSSQEAILFEFFWARLPNAIPALIADHGIMLPQLWDALRSESHTW